MKLTDFGDRFEYWIVGSGRSSVFAVLPVIFSATALHFLGFVGALPEGSSIIFGASEISSISLSFLLTAAFSAFLGRIFSVFLLRVAVPTSIGWPFEWMELDRFGIKSLDLPRVSRSTYGPPNMRPIFHFAAQKYLTLMKFIVAADGNKVRSQVVQVLTSVFVFCIVYIGWVGAAYYWAAVAVMALLVLLVSFLVWFSFFSEIVGYLKDNLSWRTRSWFSTRSSRLALIIREVVFVSEAKALTKEMVRRVLLADAVLIALLSSYFLGSSRAAYLMNSQPLSAFEVSKGSSEFYSGFVIVRGADGIFFVDEGRSVLRFFPYGSLISISSELSDDE